MTSTELKIGLTNSARPSSRVLKPPGGGHSNIFGDVDVKVNAPRAKYNQQNSSNLNACMNSIDPNKVVEKIRGEISNQATDVKAASPAVVAAQTPAPVAASAPAPAPVAAPAPAPVSAPAVVRAPAPESKKSPGSEASFSSNDSQQTRGRVPPGGFSSGGFW